MKPTATSCLTGALIFLGMLWAAPGPAQAQSFDCRRASTPDEIVICSYDWLAMLDDYMGARYRDLLKAPDVNRRILKQNQRAWLRARASCGGRVACVANSYTQRLEELDRYGY